MAQHQLSYLMLQREAVRMAAMYKLEPDYSHKSMDNFVFEYDVKRDEHLLYYKLKIIAFDQDDLEMSIDDFCDRILHPFILTCLTDDLKFIHLDCS